MLRLLALAVCIPAILSQGFPGGGFPGGGFPGGGFPGGGFPGGGFPGGFPGGGFPGGGFPGGGFPGGGFPCNPYGGGGGQFGQCAQRGQQCSPGGQLRCCQGSTCRLSPFTQSYTCQSQFGFDEPGNAPAADAAAADAAVDAA